MYALAKTAGNVSSWYQIIIEDASWAECVLAVTDPTGQFAVGFANASRHVVDDIAAALAAEGWPDVDPRDCILMSDRPGFGADRRYVLDDGIEPDSVPRIPDGIGGAWVVLHPEWVREAEWTSGSSGSMINIEWRPGSWTIIGWLPVQDGVIYRGLYWDALAQVLTARSTQKA
jgi:hypothetical protein